MNIFVLDSDPKVSAKMLCDKHVIKMILESCQILCTVAHGLKIPNVPYRATHQNHPCTIWASNNRANAKWLYEHLEEMCDEYTLRYQKTHKSSYFLPFFQDDLLPRMNPGTMTPFAQAMPEQYRNKDAVIAYRAYYVAEKQTIATWKVPSFPPPWWTV